MKWFWAAIAALFAAGALVLLAPTDEGREAPSSAEAPVEEPPPPPLPEVAPPEDPPTIETVVAVAATPESPTTPVTEPATAPASPPDAAPAAATPVVATPAPLPTPVPAPDPAPAPTPAAPPDPARPSDTRRPEETVRRIDARTIELDGRFRVTGAGRDEDPYRITWELLTSASSAIDAEKGLLDAPPWVRIVDGTYIEISAYYSTALRVQRASSVLLTLNRWDGCCIGLPPTPFDAIDCSMREPLEFRGLHLVRFGTFRGRLVVEPFAAAGFLLGIYRLEDATFVSK